MSTYYEAYSYEDAKSVFIEMLDKKLPIYLLGSGGNGKSFLLNDCEDLIYSHKRIVFCQDKIPKYEDQINDSYIICIHKRNEIIKEPALVLSMDNILYESSSNEIHQN